MSEPLLIWEIGAGFNTPGVVRYPLERLAAQHADARFVRINREYPEVPDSLADRAVGIAGVIRAGRVPGNSRDCGASLRAGRGFRGRAHGTGAG